ncbi:MAG: dihydroorotase [Thermoplasmatales archaeon E-plasma]|nr:MAG: dihydroorotase [Thermoplasmatales archaeon E-plasma]
MTAGNGDSELYFHGKFYRNGIFDDLYIGVNNGKICEISKFRNNTRVVELENAVFSASTDIHVHFRDPGETEKEDFSTGSMSAIFGGTTTVFDMPNNTVPVVDYEVYENKRNSLRGRSFCDYGLYTMFNGVNANIIHEESAGIKIYMGESTNAKGVEDIDETNQALAG